MTTSSDIEHIVKEVTGRQKKSTNIIIVGIPEPQQNLPKEEIYNNDLEAATNLLKSIKQDFHSKNVNISRLGFIPLINL